MNIEEAIKNHKGTIVDVRTPGEFMGGHAEHSINIPLHEVPARWEEISAMTAPIIVCCAAGGKSAQAHAFLSSKGVKVLDAGSWLDVHYIQSKTEI